MSIIMFFLACSSLELAASSKNLLVIMGQGIHLEYWMQRVVKSPGLAHVDLVLGVYDSDDASTLGCADPKRISCLSVAGTTWTTGRNALIKAALGREREQDANYSFWTLADADLLLHCSDVDHADETEKCLELYDAFLASLPKSVAAVTLIANGSWSFMPNSAMVGLKAMDAAWNSFRHEALHILFPYQPDLDANTWWSSQAIFWYRLQCLAPWYVVAPLGIFYLNTEHANYPRNPRNYEREHEVGSQLMGGLILPRAPSHYSWEFKQEKIRHLPLALDQPMGGAFDLCSKAFSSGFNRWVENS